MKIREYKDSDSEELIEMHRKSIRGLASGDYSEEEISAWSDLDPEEYELEEGQHRYLAIEDGNIVGFGDYNRKEKELTGLYVHPDFTGQGIGKSLLKKLEKEARKDGIDRLTCTSTITAKEFYKKNGWKTIKKSTHEIEDQELEVYEMEKEL